MEKGLNRATSIATVIGAIFGHENWGNLLMWGGMLATFGLFAYVAFIYTPVNSSGQHTMIGAKQTLMV